MGIGIGAIATTLLGTGLSVAGQLKAGAAAKEAEKARQNLENIQAQRERTQQIRQARIKRAEILQIGENEGAAGSSSVTSGASGVLGAAFQNIQYINQQVSAGKAIHNARQKQADAQGIATLGQGLATVGGTIFNNRQNLKDIFTQDTSTIYDIEEPIG